MPGCLSQITCLGDETFLYTIAVFNTSWRSHSLSKTRSLCRLFGRQFRYPLKEVTLELPAGKLEIGEEPFVTAQRELKEETGCTGRDWVPMGKMYPTPGICTEVDWLWFCRVDTESDEQELDEDEFIETERIPLEKAVEMVMNGEIPDAKTQLMILKTEQYLRKNQ